MNTDNEDEKLERAIGKLLGHVRVREPVPEIVERRVRKQVEQAWQRTTVRRRRRMFTAMAAGVALVALAIGLSQWLSTVAEPFAMVAQQSGELRINGELTGSVDAASIALGDELATGATGGVALALANGVSVRIDHDSKLLVTSARQLELLAGGVYLDSGDTSRPDTSMTVITKLGQATDVGTQFEVRLTDERLAVSVREGRVDVTHAAVHATAVAGQILLLDDFGAVTHSAISPLAPAWGWAEALAPTFYIDGRSLFDFLTWAARETGRRLVFKDAGIERAAHRAVLSGSSEGFTPEQALAYVPSMTAVPCRVEHDQIIVGD